jgi:peptidoglycan/xylan/chitin deacetylase (PgdA/CDA1 family)
VPKISHHVIARARRLLDSRWRGRGLVLLYHRVAAPRSDPQRLAVSPEVFSEQLDLICRDADPVPLDLLIDQAQRGTLRGRPVAVTFDDGYADVLHAAAPLLASRRVPATVFVTSEAVERGEFWWDTVARRVLDAGLDADWHVEMPASTPRQRVYLDWCARLRALPMTERTRLLDELPGSPAAPDAACRPMTPEEVSRLASTGVSVGSHTRSHASLASLSAGEQFEEIAAGRAAVEQWIGRSSTLFSYPFGGEADISRDVIAAARRAGVTIACSTQGGRVGAHIDPWHVPRVTMRNWSGSDFRERWNAWMAAS